jgi:hypothetical protein
MHFIWSSNEAGSDVISSAGDSINARTTGVDFDNAPSSEILGPTVCIPRAFGVDMETNDRNKSENQ